MTARKPHGPNSGHWRKKNARPIIGHCPTTGKLSFATRAKARKELLRYQGESAPRAVYRCRHCELWHLTSQRRSKAKAA